METNKIYCENCLDTMKKMQDNFNDLVYDPFMGSGTTAKSAKILKRNYIGSEISPEYCKIAQDRLDHLTGNLF